MDAVLADVVNKSADQMRRSWLEQRLRVKLAEQGCQPEAELVSAFATHILTHKTERFVFPREGEDTSVTITFDDADFADFDLRVDKFVGVLPKVIDETSDQMAKRLVTALKNKWRQDEAESQYVDFVLFRSRIETRWGAALDLLRIILTIAREHGADAATRLRKSRAKHGREVRSVLLLLHGRACQVTAEILALLENGFADGAIARWRTLYEISVVAHLISNGGDDLAQRYCDHRAVEAKNALDEYDRCRTQLGFAAVSKEERATTLAEHDRVLARYGRSFASAHGWASNYIGKTKPTFGDLQAAAGRAAMGSYFRMASHNVHAGPEGVFRRLGLLDPEPTILAGATDAGLDAAGGNAALSLTQITFLLMPRHPTIMELIAMKALVELQQAAERAFLRVGRTLRRDARGRGADARPSVA